MVALLNLVLTAGPVVVVVDVSAGDAIYEDISRGLAEALVSALGKAGFEAVRVDENELPADGCRAGPCLEKLARAHRADAVVLLDAAEDEQRTRVALMGLGGRDGRPLAGTRYVLGRKAKKQVLAFISQLHRGLGTGADAGMQR